MAAPAQSRALCFLSGNAVWGPAASPPGTHSAPPFASCFRKGSGDGSASLISGDFGDPLGRSKWCHQQEVSGRAVSSGRSFPRDRGRLCVYKLALPSRPAALRLGGGAQESFQHKTHGATPPSQPPRSSLLFPGLDVSITSFRKFIYKKASIWDKLLPAHFGRRKDFFPALAHFLNSLTVWDT